MIDIEAAPSVDPHRSQNDLLQAPSASAQEMAVDRLEATYVNKDDEFRILQRSYDRQYAQLYFARLMVMSQRVREQATQRWPNVKVYKILDVGALEEPTEAVVIGTLYKDMKLKPSILDEYTKDRGLSAALNATSFCSDDDGLVLEDEGARMPLTGDALPVQELVTGVVVAVRGVQRPGEDFQVTDLVFAGMPAQPPRPVVEVDKYVALVSGLRLSSKSDGYLQLQMALDMLSGNLGSGADQELASKVVRVVIAGNSAGNLDAIAAANAYTRQQSYALQPLKDMDVVVSELAAALPVDVMPGGEDPTNVALPQQPLHRCLFPGAGAYGSFVRATNPHAFEVDGVHFLGTSGQTIEDLAKYSRGGDRLDLMCRCLDWAHLAPTAPDTLSTYPFPDRDPFILGSTPHVLFAGNQPGFATRTVTGPAGQEVRVVALPAFSSSSTLVLLNLRTLACHPISFGAGAEAGTQQ